jgi:transposase
MQGTAVPAEISAGFVLLPKRWVVERTHAWTERWRRTVMHHDCKLSDKGACFSAMPVDWNDIMPAMRTAGQ